jgi:hypothetical protein
MFGKNLKKVGNKTCAARPNLSLVVRGLVMVVATRTDVGDIVVVVGRGAG